MGADYVKPLVRKGFRSNVRREVQKWDSFQRSRDGIGPVPDKIISMRKFMGLSMIQYGTFGSFRPSCRVRQRDGIGVHGGLECPATSGSLRP